MQVTNIFDYIKQEETKFELPTEVIDGWDWSMKDHIKTSIFYKNGRLKTGNTDDKPVKNIILPILNLEYRAEDIDVKDIEIYVDDPSLYHLSFLIKKYHDDVFVVENDIDTFLDEEKEEMIDLGGVLIKDIGEAKPDIVRMQDIAFCNQNDILSSPIGIKHIYSPDKLKEMEKKGWKNVDMVIDAAGADKGDIIGKDIKVYEVHGILPSYFLNDDDVSYTESKEYVRQIHIVAFYKNDSGERTGVSLFKRKIDKNIFKLNKRDNIYNRGLGRGGVEELFEPQVWTNYSQIQKKNLLDAASKIIIQTTDSSVAAKHPSGLKNMKNLEVVTLEKDSVIGQIDTYPRNIALFDKWDTELQEHARSTGAAQEAIMGEQPTANTPFKSVEFQSNESHSLHNYRIGKHAKFVEEMYRDLFIPHIIKQIIKGKKFLSTIDLKDMQKIVENVVKNKVNNFIKDKLLATGFKSIEEIEEFKQSISGLEELTKKDFMKDNKKFIEILKDEFKNVPISIKINVSGKQKNLISQTDKLVNIFKQVIGSVNPQTGESILSKRPFAELFNQIIEGVGLSPIDFSGFTEQTTERTPQLTEQSIPQSIIQPEMAFNNVK